MTINSMHLKKKDLFLFKVSKRPYRMGCSPNVLIDIKNKSDFRTKNYELLFTNENYLWHYYRHYRSLI